MNALATPGFDAFRAAYEAGRGALVWRHDVADMFTPVAAFLRLAHGKKYSFLLESVEGGAARGRYSVIGMAPDLIWRCDRGVATMNRDVHEDPERFLPVGIPPLESLRDLIAETRLDVPETLPPMTGGLSGYLGYDMVRLMEAIPDSNPDDLGIPDALLVRPSLFAIFDGVTDELTIAAPVYPRAGISAAMAYAAAELRLKKAAAALNEPIPVLPSPSVRPRCRCRT
jgi:anthranilate synthase component 1